MGILDNKGWQAQELYNEYLDLKTDINESIQYLEVGKSFGTIPSDCLKEKEDEIQEKVKRMREILNHLKIIHGIAMEDLILLSIGVNV